MELLSEDEQETVGAFFATLNERDVDYVVLRKYKGLPSAAPDDIDIFVDPQHFDHAVDVAESLGFGPERTPGSDDSAHPVWKALRNPWQAPKFARRFLSFAVNQLPQPPEQPPDVEVVHRQYGTVKLDMANHLRYPEWGGTRVPDSVERQMLDNRQLQGEVYVPAPADELVHLVAHCLADYGGQFPDYYIDTIDELLDKLDSDPEKRARFERLLDTLYGDDAAAISARVHHGDYEQLGEQSSKLYRQPTLVQSLATQLRLGQVFDR